MVSDYLRISNAAINVIASLITKLNLHQENALVLLRCSFPSFAATKELHKASWSYRSPTCFDGTVIRVPRHCDVLIPIAMLVNANNCWKICPSTTCYFAMVLNKFSCKCYDKV